MRDSSSAPRLILRRIYGRLVRSFGPQRWWPGETPLEVAVGAILTQNTAWANASLAIRSLKKRRFLSVGALDRLPKRRLAVLIRSSGYFNQKAGYLKRFIRYVRRRHAGRIDVMRRRDLQVLRGELLSLKGIGPETADSILLYALNKPVFVVDAYTRRILARHSLVPFDAGYDEIQALFMNHLAPDERLFNEYHAQLVAVGKGFCRPRHPRCGPCPLRSIGRLRFETVAPKSRQKAKKQTA